MNKNTVKRGLPPSSTRPIVKSELDPALFVKARQDLPAGTSPDEIDAYALRLEQFRKLLQLAAHFSVNVLVGESWASLALRLVDAFEPAFQVREEPPKRPGRAGKIDWARLCAEVQRLIGEGHSQKAACRLVAERHHVSPGSLRTIFARATKSSGASTRRPIVLSELDPLLLQRGREHLPGGASSTEVEQNAAAFEQALRLFSAAERLGFDTADETHWFLFTLGLAEFHLPGLRVAQEAPRTRGRPNGSTKIDRSRLSAGITGLVANGHSVMRACELLVRRPEWRGNSAGGLRSAYCEHLEETRRRDIDRIIALSTYLRTIETAGGLDGYLSALFRSD